MKHNLQAETLGEEVVRLRARVVELEAALQTLQEEVKFWRKVALDGLEVRE